MKIIQGEHLPVHVQIHGKALEADAVHLKIQHIRRYRNILLSSGKDIINELLIRPHICNRRAGRFQTAAPVHIHGQRNLQQIIFKKCGIRLIILPHVNGNLELPVLSRKLPGAHLFSIQRITD